MQFDAERLRQVMAAGVFKHWWLAEQLGIHRTTLRRWLSGSIKECHAYNGKRVAQFLEAQSRGVQNRLLTKLD